jgi:cell volume regulation protein A
LYGVFTLGLTLLTYGSTTIIGGNGFLAVYIAGIVLGNQNFVHKRSVLRFHDGIAWLMQIVMFLTLGLLVFPSRLVPIAGSGMLLALFLVFVARPLSVMGALTWFRRSLPEQLMVAWAGLRGAVPIVLATFPLLAGVPQAEMIFNVVFFAVVVSVLLQGLSIDWVARLLRVNDVEQHVPAEQAFVPEVRLNSQIVEAIVPPHSPLVGKSLIELDLPPGVLVVQIQRGMQQIMPDGGTVLKAEDHLLALVTPEALPVLQGLRDSVAVTLVSSAQLGSS